MLHRSCCQCSHIAQMLLRRLMLEGAAEPVEGVEQPQEAAETIHLHPATSREVQALCQDLQVLGRSEFKALLKWCVHKSQLCRQQDLHLTSDSSEHIQVHILVHSRG